VLAAANGDPWSAESPLIDIFISWSVPLKRMVVLPWPLHMPQIGQYPPQGYYISLSVFFSDVVQYSYCLLLAHFILLVWRVLLLVDDGYLVEVKSVGLDRCCFCGSKGPQILSLHMAVS